MLSPKTIWITGASGGIGAALALLYASNKTQLVLSGRNEQKMQNIAKQCIERGARVKMIVFDVCNPAEIAGAIEQAVAFTGSIDILVCNAGVGQRALAETTKIEVAHQIMDTNFWGNVVLVQALLPVLKRQSAAQIVVTSSISGLYGFPLRSMYAASKHALTAYFETLSLELARTNIWVTIICPGRINSEFAQRALLFNGTGANVTDTAHLKSIKLEKAARKIKKAIDKKRKMLVFGKKEMALWYLKRINYGFFYYIASKLPHNS